MLINELTKIILSLSIFLLFFDKIISLRFLICQHVERKCISRTLTSLIASGFECGLNNNGSSPIQGRGLAGKLWLNFKWKTSRIQQITDRKFNSPRRELEVSDDDWIGLSVDARLGIGGLFLTYVLIVILNRRDETMKMCRQSFLDDHMGGMFNVCFLAYRWFLFSLFSWLQDLNLNADN